MVLQWTSCFNNVSRLLAARKNGNTTVLLSLLLNNVYDALHFELGTRHASVLEYECREEPMDKRSICYSVVDNLGLFLALNSTNTESSGR